MLPLCCHCHPRPQLSSGHGRLPCSHTSPLVSQRPLRRAAETEPPGPRLLPGTVRRGLGWRPPCIIKPLPSSPSASHMSKLPWGHVWLGARVAGGRPERLGRAPPPPPGSPAHPPHAPVPGNGSDHPHPRAQPFRHWLCWASSHALSHGAPAPARRRVSEREEQAQSWAVTRRGHSASLQSGLRPPSWALPHVPSRLVQWPAARHRGRGELGILKHGPPLPYMELCLGAWPSEALAEVGTGNALGVTCGEGRPPP